MNKTKLFYQAFTNSVGVLVYCGLVACLMTYGNRFFGQINGPFGIAAFLLLFVLSAAVVGSLVLGRPIILYLDGKKKESLVLFFYTVGILFVFTAVILGIFAILNK